jgi:hypothetical protein
MKPAGHRPVTVAFHYAAHSSVPDLRYLANFDVLVTGGILSANQLQTLQHHKTKLILYTWSSGFYPGEGTPAEHTWQARVVKRAKDWLLARDLVGGGAASPGKSAYWYDFGDPGIGPALADHIGAILGQSGYRGVFLDTLGSDALPPSLREEFRRRHPGKHYSEEQAQFISILRAKLGEGGIIFTNQGYRTPDLFLRHATFDLVENSFTHISASGVVEFRPWHKSGAEWDGIEVPMTNLVVPAARSYPDTQFVHLNYAAGDAAMLQRVVDYCYACARLWNQSSFVASPGVQKPIHSNVYFGRVGAPASASYEQDREHGIAWRVFQNAVVAVNSSNKPYRIRKLQLSLPDGPRGYIFKPHP